MNSAVQHPASFRDPAGFIFNYEDKVYRQVNKVYQPHFEQLMGSGLYQELVSQQWLVAHEVVQLPLEHPDAFLYLKPEAIPFISHPYEWSFSMLKDAALLTLTIAETALKYGMMLKDASAYNLQYHRGKMIFMDTLSFEVLDPSKPWIAYRQFCTHFLAPLALMHYAKAPMQGLQLGYPEGIPLQLASVLLPWKTRWKLHLYLHIHLNATVTRNHSEKKRVSFSKQKSNHILSSLQEAIKPLRLDQKGTWSDYYSEAAERNGYLEAKMAIMADWLSGSSFKTAFDAGANDGTFSRLLSSRGIATLAADGDHGAVNNLYETLKVDPATVHPLFLDLAHPTPAIGVNNEERSSLLGRVSVDLVLALAVVHHLAIAKRIPFERIADFFSSMGRTLIIEFVSPEDNKVQAMVQDSTPHEGYNEAAFRAAFGNRFTIVREQQIPFSNRILFLLQRI